MSEVQARGGLVEHVERAARLHLARELARELHALRLAARERGGGLPQRDVAEARPATRLSRRSRMRGMRPEELEGLIHVSARASAMDMPRYKTSSVSRL
jgi:hypothetical protein